MNKPKKLKICDGKLIKNNKKYICDRLLKLKMSLLGGWIDGGRGQKRV